MIRASRRSEDYARGVERLLADGSAVGLSETQLVERFATRRDDSAFAALVDRHGPMVLGVCRRLLRDPNDADDAFQAVFLVLARKAGGLRRKELVGNWLYGVAGRVASEARRRPRTAVAADPSAFDVDARRTAPPDPSDAAARDEDGRRLHEEVGRLPARYRAPVVACYFEGRTHEEAAALLNCPVGTVKGRLARARDLLRARLERRGVTAPAALLATALAAPDLHAAVPPALACQAVAGALAAVASPTAWMTVALSTSVRSLSEGAIQAMFYAQMKSIAIPATLAVGLLAAGAGLATAGREAPQAPGETVPAAAAKVASPAAESPTAEEFVTDRPLGLLSPIDVLKRIDGTGKAVMKALKEAEIDLVATAGPVEMREEIDRVCDQFDRQIVEIRSSKVEDPKGRALLDAFADDLSTLLELRKGRGLAGSTVVQDLELLDGAYFAFDRSLTQARKAESTESAGKRYALTIVPIVKTLREPIRGGVSKPLLAAYADYLEAFDPFAERPAFRRVQADAPATRDRPSGRSVEAVLNDVWGVIGQYQKSHQAAVQFPFNNAPIKQEEREAALARHVARIERLGKNVRDRAAGDPLLLSLADYLTVASEPSASDPGTLTGPGMAIGLIGLVRTNLQASLKEARDAAGPNPSEFDREVARETLAKARTWILDDSTRQAERDPEARDLLTCHAEYVRKLLDDDAFLFPASEESVAPASPIATAFVDPAPAGTVNQRPIPPPVAAGSPPTQPNPAPAPAPAAEPAVAPTGGGRRASRPSPEEVRQKVAGLAATLASVDKDPNNRKVYAVLDQPVVLSTEGEGTLGRLIEQVRASLKAEDGTTIPLYVDLKGLESADASLDSPVSIDLDGAPLKFALRLALKQLGLASCVRDGVLIISSLDGVEQELLEAQREMAAAEPDRFRVEMDGTIRPAGTMSQPGGMR